MSHQGRNRRRGWLAGMAPRAAGLTLGIAIVARGHDQPCPGAPRPCPSSGARCPAPPAPGPLAQPSVRLRSLRRRELAPGTAVVAPDVGEPPGSLRRASRSSSPTSRSSGFRDRRDWSSRCSRPTPTPVSDRRRRRDHHGRPQARRRLSAAAHQHPRAAGQRALSRHRGRRPSASARGNRPRQVPDPRGLQSGRS